MDNDVARKSRLPRAISVCALVSLTACLLFIFTPASAGGLRIVKGIVGSVAGDLLYVGGKSVGLRGIPIRNASGKELSGAQITPGTKVGLFYRSGTLESVLVYEPMVE